MPPPADAPPPRPGLIWSWERALIGAAYALPAAVATLHNPATGIPLPVGVLPAAIIPIPPRRRARIVILVIGVLAGASLFLGGVLAHLATVGTCAMLVASVIAASTLASARSFGIIVLVLCTPLIGAGLSYDEYSTSASAFMLLTTGAAYAWLVSLLWPQRVPAERPHPPLPQLRAMVGYGTRLGVAAALGYAIASALDLDHPGWAPAACLLVARPQLDLLQRRGVAGCSRWPPEPPSPPSSCRQIRRT